jgi:hypothetical protein
MMSLNHVQSKFHPKMAIVNRAKQLINEHPGMYTGNLKYHLQEENEFLSGEEIRQVFFQLFKDGYERKVSSFYPPNTLDPEYKLLRKFTIMNKDLGEMDLEILETIRDLKERANVPDTTRRVISQNIGYSEQVVKYRIGILFRYDVILAKPSNQNPVYLDINWNLITGRD